MNLFSNITSFPALLAAVMCLSATQLHAQSTTNAPRSIAEERVLVILETSVAMQKRAENTQKILGEMFSTALDGDMRSGDTVGMWTFNDELSTGQFPLQRWTKATRQRIAVTMVQFLQQQRYEKTARPAMFWESLTNIVTHSERITVIIISSGSEVISGTPFDESIAQNFLKNEESQRKAKMPFVTILRAYHGKFVNFSVNLPPWPMELPEYPREARRAAEPVVKIEPEAKDPPAPLPPLIVNGNEPRPAPTPTNTIYATNIPVEPIKQKPAETNPTPATITNIIAPTAPKQELQHAKESTTAKPIPRAAATATPIVAETDSALPSKTILVTTIASLIGVIVVLIALLLNARRATGESLITKIMSKKRD